MLGQSVRSVKEALAVADDDLDALTALLDVRLVAGDAALVDDLVAAGPRTSRRAGATGCVDALARRGGGTPSSTRDRSPRCSSPT